MRSPLVLTLIAGALLAAAPAHANGPSERLAALTAAEANLAAQRSKSTTAALKQQLVGPLQTVGTLQSLTGAPDAAMVTFDEIAALQATAANSAPGNSAAIAWTTGRDAVGVIVEQARNRQVVILNEAQHVPAQRAFAMRLARELRKVGFTHLAVEALGDNPLAKGYLTPASGMYVAEPTFANFLRDAQQQNWHLIAYEFKFDGLGLGADDNVSAREQGQVDNLVKRVLAREPKARIFIYASANHVRERIAAGDTWMAGYLRERTGIDPLTIDQATMISHGGGSGEHPLYQQLLAKNGGSGPFVLTRVGNPEVFGKYRGEVDMQVVHPPYPLVSSTGRPQWMTSLAGWKSYSIPSALWPSSGRRLIELRRKGAPPDEVALDAVLAVAGQKPPSMMAPAGDVEFSASE
ncbi:hypothetical protein [Massilia sp. CF038]|uniref:hypothetical protein n=1 Tax=Massilia sp. CF038 TaxID=1881045 RepID=UPI000920006E|nr:hypothetical protein [Massilia sp. CF038]SHH38900.1 hypothetical protein SAMN05428948_3780 [Massilia sp. CF038]